MNRIAMGRRHIAAGQDRCGRCGSQESQYSNATFASLSGVSEIDADRDVTACQLGKGGRLRPQFRKCLVLCHRLLYLSVHFPTGIACRDKKLPGPHTSVKPGKPKKFGAVLFE